MADIDIASPGANEDALKAALGALGMPVLLAGGTISSPVDYLSISLPVGFWCFQLRFAGLTTDDNWISAVVQAGDIVYCDNANNDTYSLMAMNKRQLNFDPPIGIGELDNDNLIDFGGKENYGVCTIYPGSASAPPVLEFVNTWMQDGTIIGAFVQHFSLNPGAIVTPILARITEFIFLPYGDEVFPPTAVTKLTAGSWALFGLAA